MTAIPHRMMLSHAREAPALTRTNIRFPAALQPLETPFGGKSDDERDEDQNGENHHDP
jgi:hypothetical protein